MMIQFKNLLNLWYIEFEISMTNNQNDLIRSGIKLFYCCNVITSTAAKCKLKNEHWHWRFICFVQQQKLFHKNETVAIKVTLVNACLVTYMNNHNVIITWSIVLNSSYKLHQSGKIYTKILIFLYIVCYANFYHKQKYILQHFTKIYNILKSNNIYITYNI